MYRRLLLLVALLTALVSASSCEGDRGPVGPEGPAGPPFTVSHSAGCDGIQRAIDSLPPTGGQVIVEKGDYACTDPIVVARSNVDLRGQGPATVLRLAAGANSPVIVIGDTIPVPVASRRNIHVSDLTVDGNRQNQDTTIECRRGPCTPANPLRNNGITVRRVSDVIVERVTVFSARSGGLVSELGSERVTVRDYTSFDNRFDGLAAYETENSAFSRLYLYDNLAAGLSFDGDFNNNIVTDAVIVGSRGVGIFMRDSRDNLFVALQIRNSGDHGVFLAQVDTDPTAPASGNTFSDIVVSGSAGAGLRVNDASCVNNLVTGSQFIGNSGGCISEAVPGLVQVTGTICR